MNDRRYEDIILYSLKKHVCNTISKGSLFIGNFECPICIETGSWGVKLQCSHIYHIPCILKWINLERSCPLCRNFCEDKFKKYLNRNMSRYKDSLNNIPMETLLEFQSSIPIVLYYNDHEFLKPDVFIKFFRLATRNKKLVNAYFLATLEQKYYKLLEIRHEIKVFNLKSGLMNYVRSQDTVIEAIKNRIYLPFEQLYNRVDDHSKEMRKLEDYTCYNARILRQRLFHLWKIEKTIKQFINELLHFNMRTTIGPINRLRITSSQFPTLFGADI